jgi:class 3 adenylate cyclase
MSAATEHRKLAAILFTDMVGYSALARRDEPVALELLEEHRQVQRGFAPAGPGNCSSRNQL